MNISEPTPPPPPAEGFYSSHAQTNWPLFWIALLSPALLTIGSVLLGAKGGDTAPVIAVFSGGISGIICGTILGRRFGRTTGLKVVLAVIFAAVFAVVCIGMSCCGCLASGYNLKF